MPALPMAVLVVGVLLGLAAVGMLAVYSSFSREVDGLAALFALGASRQNLPGILIPDCLGGSGWSDGSL
jgi:hypothetical protein